MLRFRLFRLCSVPPFSIHGNKIAGSHLIHTVKMGLRGKKNMEKQHPILQQNVIVMRHSERIDNFEPLWASMASRPWDPPLSESGQVRAFQTGRRIKQSLGFTIDRVFVSPFLRCIQTAAEVGNALLINDGDGSLVGDRILVDSTKLKVSIEYGLCEMINSIAIRLNVAPKDGNLSFDITELKAMLPARTVGDNGEMVYKELPEWEESVLQARARYQQTIQNLADKYPTENLLFVTHGEGIQVAVSSFRKDVVVNEVEYCGYVELTRPIFKKDHSLIGGEFNLLTQSGQSGVTYISSHGL